MSVPGRWHPINGSNLYIFYTFRNYARAGNCHIPGCKWHQNSEYSITTESRNRQTGERVFTWKISEDALTQSFESVWRTWSIKYPSFIDKHIVCTKWLRPYNNYSRFFLQAILFEIRLSFLTSTNLILYQLSCTARDSALMDSSWLATGKNNMITQKSHFAWCLDKISFNYFRFWRGFSH